LDARKSRRDLARAICEALSLAPDAVGFLPGLRRGIQGPTPSAATPPCPRQRTLRWGNGHLSRGALVGQKAGPRSAIGIDRAHLNAS
jgi:hypothetical protein